jgi:uroporphyrinogen III methyltransferase/synthase
MPNSPLAGKRILITSAQTHAAELRHKLAERGVVPVLFPAIEFATLANNGPLDEAIRVISQFNWLVFDSAWAVGAFWGPFRRLGLDERVLRDQRFGVVGKTAARALTKHGPLAEFVAEPEDSAVIAERFADLRGQWVLFVRGAEWRDPLAEALTARGAALREIVAYRTLPAAPDPGGLAELQRGVEAIVFAEPVAVKNFVTLVGREAAGSATMACVGPTTARLARELGLVVAAVARTPTAKGLVEALEHFSFRRN